MIIRKDKGVRVLKYTFVIMGAICLTQVPMTNSKYITSSELNNDYFEYNAGFRKLSYDEEAFPSGTKPNQNSLTTSEIEFKVPRNTNNGIQDGDKDTYRFESSTCRITSITGRDGTNNVNGTITNPTGTISSGNPSSGEINFNGSGNTDITVKMTCNTTQSNPEIDTDLIYPVELGSMAETNASIAVYEKIGTKEAEFAYRSYKQKFINPSSNPVGNSVDIQVSAKEPFKEYIEWIVRYSHTTSDTKIIKDYVRDRLEEYLEENYGDKYNINAYVNDISSPAHILDIQGIDRVNDESKTTFSINSNLIGYIKTYNSVKDTSDNNLNLYFSSQIKNDKDRINKIFDEYIEEYIDEYYKTKDENSRKVIKDYLKGTGYDILKGKRTIAGIVTDDKEVCISIHDIDKLLSAAEAFESNTFMIKKQSQNIVEREFKTALDKSILVIDMKNSDIVSKSFINGESIAKYVNKGELDVDYNKDRYVIYRSKANADKFLLLKITKDTENDDCMRVYLSDLDSALDEYEQEVQDRIFTFESEKDEIYINIDTTRYGNATDFAKVGIVVDKLNKALENSYNAGPMPDEDPVNRGGTRYYEYKYEIVQTQSNEQGVQEASLDESELYTENMLINDDTANISEDDKILNQDNFEAPEANYEASTADKNINSIQDIKTDKQNSKITSPELSGKDKNDSSTIKNDDNVERINKTESDELNNIDSSGGSRIQTESPTPEVNPIS